MCLSFHTLSWHNEACKTSLCRLALAEKGSACFRSTSTHQWELLLSWGSTLHVFSTLVKDFPQCREKINPKSPVLPSHLCWSIIPWGVCVCRPCSQIAITQIWGLVKQVHGIYLPVLRWMKKCGKRASSWWLCLCQSVNWIGCVKKSGAICCLMELWISVFKLSTVFLLSRLYKRDL